MQDGESEVYIAKDKIGWGRHFLQNGEEINWKLGMRKVRVCMYTVEIIVLCVYN